MFCSLNKLNNALLVLSILISITMVHLIASGPLHGQQQSACLGEMINTNRSLAEWADNLEEMVNESTLPATIKQTLFDETDRVLDMIGDFGDNITRKEVEQLSKDLVNIRRRSNRLALDIYLNTFDMRWPHTSLQLGILVERVQQACSSSLGLILGQISR